MVRLSLGNRGVLVRQATEYDMGAFSAEWLAFKMEHPEAEVSVTVPETAIPCPQRETTLFELGHQH